MVKEIRTCRCGCQLQFTVNPTSRKIDFNRRHKDNAKNFRRKFKDAGVLVES